MALLKLRDISSPENKDSFIFHSRECKHVLAKAKCVYNGSRPFCPGDDINFVNSFIYTLFTPDGNTTNDAKPHLFVILFAKNFVINDSNALPILSLVQLKAEKIIFRPRVLMKVIADASNCFEPVIYSGKTVLFLIFFWPLSV